MFCSYCGKENNEKSSFCVYCGKRLEKRINKDIEANAQVDTNNNIAKANSDIKYEVSGSNETLRILAFIFNLLATIGFGLLLIPLSWMIPMTVHSWGVYKGKKANTIAFGVCTLIFLNLVSGILLLCAKHEN